MTTHQTIIACWHGLTHSHGPTHGSHKWKFRSQVAPLYTHGLEGPTECCLFHRSLNLYYVHGIGNNATSQHIFNVASPAHLVPWLASAAIILSRYVLFDKLHVSDSNIHYMHVLRMIYGHKDGAIWHVCTCRLQSDQAQPVKKTMQIIQIMHDVSEVICVAISCEENIK